jgi:hypothetical protein
VLPRSGVPCARERSGQAASPSARAASHRQPPRATVPFDVRVRVAVTICSSGPTCTWSPTSAAAAWRRTRSLTSRRSVTYDVGELLGPDQFAVPAEDRQQPPVALGMKLDLDRRAPPVRVNQPQVRAVTSAVLALRAPARAGAQLRWPEPLQLPQRQARRHPGDRASVPARARRCRARSHHALSALSVRYPRAGARHRDYPSGAVADAHPPQQPCATQPRDVRVRRRLAEPERQPRGLHPRDPEPRPHASRR